MEKERKGKQRAWPKQTSYRFYDEKAGIWIGVCYTDGLFGDENWHSVIAQKVTAQLTVSIHDWERNTIIRQIAVAKSLRDHFNAILYDTQTGTVVTKDNEKKWSKRTLPS